MSEKNGMQLLEIHGVNQDDMGVYTCLVVNGSGKASMSAELSIQGLDSANRSFGRETKATNSDIRREVTNAISKASKLDSLEAAAKSKNCSSPQRGGSPAWAPKHQPQPLRESKLESYRDSPRIAPQTPVLQKTSSSMTLQAASVQPEPRAPVLGALSPSGEERRGQLLPIQPPSPPGSLAWEAKTLRAKLLPGESPRRTRGMQHSPNLRASPKARRSGKIKLSSSGVKVSRAN
ncbi:myosin light chain kinase, smooth muscle-like [Sapajus apella]|uniref:Myosin light chain kinase, smooth muscle-like n=1 Tax=Sapajus apella TaxID=9515 RepID=A0A6J3H5N4_SAPAP|nr:myosin light chain kinase, smooth muscle-like [Sapajus apella]